MTAHRTLTAHWTVRRHWLQAGLSCFKFYWMFYFTCDRSLSQASTFMITDAIKHVARSVINSLIVLCHVGDGGAVFKILARHATVRPAQRVL